MCIDLGMTTEQKIQRMRTIMNSPEFLPEIPVQTKEQALDVIIDVKERAKEISLRTLISTSKIAHNGTSNWKALAKYMLIA